MRFYGYFFDMDGVLFDSMPSHAIAWSRVLKAHGLPFEPRDAYLNEGRTGASVIRELAAQQQRVITAEDIDAIYAEKAALFRTIDDGHPMPGMDRYIEYLQQLAAADPAAKLQIWVVTGSGQASLIDKLQTAYPGVFSPERMITAYDVVHGKPDPEPYLLAWERSGLSKEQCCVIENAPLGVRAGKAAGLYTIAVNTGILPDSVLADAGADVVCSSVDQLLTLKP